MINDLKKISKFEFLQEEKYTMFCWIWQLQKTVFEIFKKRRLHAFL